MNWKEKLRSLLREMRTTKNLSLLDLAILMEEDCGISTTDRTLRRIENGAVEPRAEYIDAWQEICGKKIVMRLK